MLNLNTKEFVLQILEDIKMQSFQDWHVYVVDNGSLDDQKIQISDLNEHMTLLMQDNNTGFAEGNNIGMKQAIKDGVEYVWILNNDTRLEKDTLEKIVTYLDNHQDVAAICPKIMYEAQRDTIWYAGGIVDFGKPYPFEVCRHRGEKEKDTGQYDHISDTQFLTGCSTFVRTSTLKVIGLFDAKYFAYYEDSDFSQRMINAGLQIQYFPGARLYHMVGILHGPTSTINMYYQIRNWFYFVMTHGTLLSKLLAIGHMKLLIIKNCVKILLPHKRIQAQAQLRACWDAVTGRMGITPIESLHKK